VSQPVEALLVALTLEEIPGETPVERMVRLTSRHVGWLRALAGTWAAAELPKVALAMDEAADALEDGVEAARAYLTLGDTAILPIEER